MSLSAADPQGRLDVLALRLLERFAERKIPEWPIAKPAVEDLLGKLLGPRAKRKKRKNA